MFVPFLSRGARRRGARLIQSLLVIALGGSASLAAEPESLPPAAQATLRRFAADPRFSTWPFAEADLPQTSLDYPLAGIDQETLRHWLAAHAHHLETRLSWWIDGKKLSLTATAGRHADVRELLQLGRRGGDFAQIAERRLRLAEVHARIRSLTYSAASQENVIARLKSKRRYLSLKTPTDADLDRLAAEQLALDVRVLWTSRKLAEAEVRMWASWATAKESDETRRLAEEVERLAGEVNEHIVHLEESVRREIARIDNEKRSQTIREIDRCIANLRYGLSKHGREAVALAEELERLAQEDESPAIAGGALRLPTRNREPHRAFLLAVR